MQKEYVEIEKAGDQDLGIHWRREELYADWRSFSE